MRCIEALRHQENRVLFPSGATTFGDARKYRIPFRDVLLRELLAGISCQPSPCKCAIDILPYGALGIKLCIGQPPMLCNKLGRHSYAKVLWATPEKNPLLQRSGLFSSAPVDVARLRSRFQTNTIVH